MTAIPLGCNTHLIDIDLYRPRLGGCYLIQDGDELALIDCGTQQSLPQIKNALTDIGADLEQVRWIIPTHVHLDHAGGAGQLMRLCENATLITHPKGLPHMIDPTHLIAGAVGVYGEAAFNQHFGVLEPIDENRCIAAADQQTFDLGQRQLTFIHTPGHANHHGCIFDAASAWLYTGDTFGLGYQELAAPKSFLIATTTPVAFNPDDWQESLDRMLAMNPDAVCLTHFGKHDDPAGLAPMLRESIENHREIALKEEALNNPEERYQRLTAALKQSLCAQAMAHTGLSENRVYEILSSDIKLNAQGLNIWLARRARQREKSEAAT